MGLESLLVPSHLLHLMLALQVLPSCHDSPGIVSKHGKCCYVCSSLVADSVTKPVPNTLTLRLALFYVFILMVYCPPPPSSTHIVNEHLVGFLTDFCPAMEVVIVKDFNLLSIG